MIAVNAAHVAVVISPKHLRRAARTSAVGRRSGNEIQVLKIPARLRHRRAGLQLLESVALGAGQCVEM